MKIFSGPIDLTFKLQKRKNMPQNTLGKSQIHWLHLGSTEGQGRRLAAEVRQSALHCRSGSRTLAPGWPARNNIQVCFLGRTKEVHKRSLSHVSEGCRLLQGALRRGGVCKGKKKRKKTEGSSFKRKWHVSSVFYIIDLFTHFKP